MDKRMMRQGGYTVRPGRAYPVQNRVPDNGINRNGNMSGANGISGVSRSPLLRRLQELDLAITDTCLYLDMYPTNTEAISYCNRLIDERERVLAEYERQNGPLTVYGAGEDPAGWDWTSRPWPWENDSTQGGGV